MVRGISFEPSCGTGNTYKKNKAGQEKRRKHCLRHCCNKKFRQSSPTPPNRVTHPQAGASWWYQGKPLLLHLEVQQGPAASGTHAWEPRTFLLLISAKGTVNPLEVNPGGREFSRKHPKRKLLGSGSRKQDKGLLWHPPVRPVLAWPWPAPQAGRRLALSSPLRGLSGASTLKHSRRVLGLGRGLHLSLFNYLPLQSPGH